jgi:hypothetical protein
MNAADLRRRVAGWRTAERREQAIRADAGPVDPAAAFNAALELYDILAIDFRDADATRVREVELSRRTWRTLRTRLAIR